MRETAPTLLPPTLLDACRVAHPAGVAPGRAGDPAPDPTPLSTIGDDDWTRLLDAARHHGVTPLLARWLATRPAADVPRPIRDTLRERYDANALRNIAFTHQLIDLLELLASHSIGAMPIKGPALAISAYGDLALREFGDLDVVVHPADFDRARELLHREGYRPLAKLSSSGERALRSSDHHLPLVHAESGVMVELHWSLDNSRRGRVLDGEWVWANARTVSLLGRELPSLSWSALLVYLCVHAAKHGLTRLAWIRDVAGVLAAAPAGELADATRIASAAAAERRLALVTTLASELLGAPLPAELRLHDGPALAALRRDVRSALSAGGPTSLVGFAAFQCRTFERLRDRAGYCLHILAAPHVADVETVALPRWLAGTYYVLRPARLVAKRARSLLGTRPST